MATYRHWSVSLWRDPDDVSHCRILSHDKTEWQLISATLCGWRRCFVADQLWFMTCIWEEVLDQKCQEWCLCQTSKFTSASCDLDLWSLDPKSRSFHLPRPVDHKCQFAAKSVFIHFKNLVFTRSVKDKRTDRSKTLCFLPV